MKTQKNPKRTTKEDKKDNKKRIPRPMGLTELCIEQTKEETKEGIYQIQKMITNYWATHNFNFLNQQMSVDEIAKFTRWSSKKVIQHISSPIKNWLEGYKVEDQYRVLLGFVTKMGMSDRAQIQGQIDVLATSQGNEYRPFISDSLNRSLNILNEQTRTMLQIVNSFKPTGPSLKVTNNTLVTGTHNPTSEHGRYLGINEAVKMLEESRPQHLLESESLQQTILSIEAPNDLPEVIATKQQGLGSDGHAAVIIKKSKQLHTDRLKGRGDIKASSIIIP